jgi:glucose-1-phosphate adenylyltransferase
VLSSDVRVHSFCNINEAVLLPQVTIERSCRLRRVVIDRGCTIPEGTVIGENAQADAERFYRTENGIVLVTCEALEKIANHANL